MTRRRWGRLTAVVAVLVAPLLAMPAAGAVGGAKPRTLTLPPPAVMEVQGGDAPADVVAAVEYAAHRWAQYLTSSVPIVIEIRWEPLGTQIGGVGGSGAMHDFDRAPHAATWYPMPLADALAGEDLYPG
jgi:hypothetical protein